MTNIFSKEFRERLLELNNAERRSGSECPTFIVIAAKEDFQQIQDDAFAYYKAEYGDIIRLTKDVNPPAEDRPWAMKFELRFPMGRLLIVDRDKELAPCSLT